MRFPLFFQMQCAQMSFDEYVYLRFLWHKMNSCVVGGKKVYSVLLVLSKI